MKRILFASIAILLSVGSTFAWRSNRSSCYRGGCARTVSCARPCQKPCEPVAPRCCKTVMVDTIVQVPKVVEVAAIKKVTPMPDIVEVIEQPCQEIHIPQAPTIIQNPDLIEYRPVPAKIVRHKQPPCVTYECPCDCEQA